MRARFFSGFLMAAACSAAPDLGSVQQAICNCNQDPVPCCCNSPILVDVAGNGFELTSMNDGVLVATRPGYQQTERAWTQPGSDDAWLVLDRNGDGVINDMSEMFGNVTPQPDPPEGQRRNGFLALALDDDNADAVIDERDPIFASLRLWQDKNHDGVSQPDELHNLSELGLAGISVRYTEARRGDANGNSFFYRASVYGTPGSKVGKDAWDVWLSGVQSMPLPFDQASARSSLSSATTCSSTDYWTCDAECKSVERACRRYGYGAGGEGDTPPEAGAAAIRNCHASISEAMYCTVDPSLDVVNYCELAVSPPPPWFCWASCHVNRNDVPAYCDLETLSVRRSGRTDGAARRSAIAACTAAAWTGFCALADDPNDTPADSPDDVIDNVTVTCDYHPYGCGGGCQ